MKVLVSGNAGFIGRNFTKNLEAYGHTVFGFDINGPDKTDAREFFAYDDHQYDLLVHAAANVGGRQAIDDTPLWVAENLEIDRKMFEWAIRTKTPVLYFSSSAAYPTYLQNKRDNPIKLQEGYINLEGLNGTPDNTYGWSKLTGEFMAAIARSKGAQVTIVRPFSGYGSDQSTDYPFGSYIEKALNNDFTFPIWGDGGQTRDWIHVDDIFFACMALVKAKVEKPVNLCTGRRVSFIELANMFMLASGKYKNVLPDPSKPTGCYHRVGDPAFLESYYKPGISLEFGIIEAIRENS